jgi:aminomethyltransferase
MPDELRKTPLNEEHQKLDGRLVEFSGWEMPLWYKTGHTEEHNAVRNGVGLFDVCHMSEFSIRGPSAITFLKTVLTNDIDKIKEYQAQYNFMLNERGGVVDDCIIYKMNDEKWMLVANAGNIESDFQHLQRYAGSDLTLTNESTNYAKLDLQGRYAPKLLSKVAGLDAVNKLGFYKFRTGIDIDGTQVIVSRTGYTGEIGFEIYFDAKDASKLWNLFLEEGKEFGILPCGLAARDSLRIEAGLPLHGHEISPDMLATGALWDFVLSEREGYIGRNAIKDTKPEYHIKPFILEGKRKAMPHYKVYKGSDEPIGEVVSGVIAPTMDNTPIGFCKIKEDLQEDEGLVFKDQTGKRVFQGKIASVPFVKGLTWRKKMKDFL